MRTSSVVVEEVLDHHGLEVASVEDEEVIQAVVSDGAHEALGERVRPRGADRRLDGLDADRGEWGYSLEPTAPGHEAGL